MLGLLDLPEEIIIMILSYCDRHTLLEVAQVSRKLNDVSSQDIVWQRFADTMINITSLRTSMNRQFRFGLVKDNCRISLNWVSGKHRNIRVVYLKSKYMPWLQFDNQDNLLYQSYGPTLSCMQLQKNGRMKKLLFSIRNHVDDICRFVVRDNFIYTAGRDGDVIVQDKRGNNTKCILHHEEAITCIDVMDCILISGTWEHNVHIFNMNSRSHQTLEVNDRVLCTAMSPKQTSFAAGSAGCLSVPPLHIWDLTSCVLVRSLGNDFRNGAGVMDIKYDSKDIIVSCGYDTFIRLWDLRLPTSQCVLELEDPQDCSIYTIDTDSRFMILSGLSHHGMVRLWDTRSPTQPLQMFYTGGRSRSPVYCVQFNERHAYVALDNCLHVLNFN